MSLRTLPMTQRYLTFQNLCVLLAVLLPRVHCAVLRCDTQNRDPCAKFPSLCTEGGGLCVIKGPCEYECVCPPDGRRGRDCSQNAPADPPKETDTSSNNGGSHVESLLVFPKDLFLDVNHVDKPVEIVRISSPRPILDGFSYVSRPTTRFQDGKSIMDNVFQRQRNQINVEDNRDPSQSSAHETTTMQTPTATNKTFDLESAPAKPVGTTTTTNPSTPVASPRALADDQIPLSKGLVPVKRNQTQRPTSVIREILVKKSSDQTGLNIKRKPNNSIPEPNVGTNKESEGKGETGNDQKRLSKMLETSTFSETQAPGKSLKTPVSHMATKIEPITFTSQTNTSGITLSPPVTDMSPSSELSKVKNVTSSFLQSDMTQLDNKDTISPEKSLGFPERFPGHELFPTFFRGNIQNADLSAKDKSNAHLSLTVQRVYHTPEQFPIFRRNHH